MNQPAREPGHPAVKDRISSGRYTASNQNFPEQNEKEDGDQCRVVGRRPSQVSEPSRKRERTEKQVDSEAKQEQDNSDRN